MFVIVYFYHSIFLNTLYVRGNAKRRFETDFHTVNGKIVVLDYYFLFR